MAAAFTQVFQAAVRATADRLTLAERGALWTLTAYIGRQDTVIRNQQGAPMTCTDIAMALGLSRPHASKMLASLATAHVIIVERHGRGNQYKFNPTLAHRFSRVVREIEGKDDNAC